MTRPRAHSRQFRLVLAILAIIGIGSCHLPIFFGDAAGGDLEPAPGTYTEPQWVRTNGNNETFYYALEESAPITDYERFPGELYVGGDTTIYYFTVTTSGLRSSVTAASYFIDDSVAPVVSLPELFFAGADYFTIGVGWEAYRPPDPTQLTANPDLLADGHPVDAVTDWYDLEFTLYSSATDNIGTYEDAEVNGTLEFGWQRGDDIGSVFPARVATPGSARWFNVFVRDRDGNVGAYQQTQFSSVAPLSLIAATTGGIGPRVRVRDLSASSSIAFLATSVGFLGPTATIKSMAAGDLSGDGLDDVAVVFEQLGSEYFQWFPSLGNGSLDTSPAGLTEFAAPLAMFMARGHIEIVDMNNDGALDLVYNNGMGDLRVTTGSRTPVDLINVTGVPAIHEVTDFTVGDLNNDRFPDVVTIDQGGAPIVRVHLNSGGTSFSTSDFLLPIPVGQIDLDLGDLDGDGNLDLVLTNDAIGSGLSVEMYYGNGDGTFVQDSFDIIGDAAGTTTVTVADFGSAEGYPDGLADIFVGNGAGVASGVAISNGDRTFFGAADTDPVLDESVATHAADMNYDGLLDVIQVFAPGGTAPIVWVNNSGFLDNQFSLSTNTITHVLAGRVQ